MITFFVFGAALLLRLILAFACSGFDTDISCFFSWANMLWENGFNSFYSPNYFCDYPPGYLYILYFLGGLLKFFGVETLSGLCLLILKLPAIICDMISGYLIWRYARKTMPPSFSLILSACYLFHPAVLINSSVWGQVDSIYTLLILLVCILLSEEKPIPAYFLFALGILLKPQVLIFSPLILCGAAEYILQTKSLKKAIINLAGGFCAIFMLIPLSLPFGIQNVLSQYTDTLSSYPYAAVNACNLWGLFGKNWVSQETKLGILTYAQIGTICIIAITLCSFALFFALRKRADRYYLTGAFLIVSVFVFSVRMHERYLFPAILLLLFAFVHNKEKICFVHYWFLSLCHFGNVYYVLYAYDPANYDRRSFPLLSVSFLTVFSATLFFYTLIKSARGLTVSIPKCFRILPAPAMSCSVSRTMPFTRWDLAAILSVSLFYGIFAFSDLGITETPVTECPFPYNTYLELDAASEKPFTEVYWYLKNEQDITCRLEIRQTPDSDWEYVQDITLKNVFQWDSFSLPAPAVSIRMTNLTKDTNIGELVFADNGHHYVEMEQAASYYPLFDEAHTFPGELSAQTGTYFDEIYYTRTVYEFMHGLPTYENTHPPFGKILILLGTMLFGTTPFGFRFMGALFGVLMLPFMYLLGRNLTHNRIVGAFTAFLFAFDFMHFAQTRLATIDVFIVFFIIVMYYFMERYISLSTCSASLKKAWLPLAFCGITFGFGIATKWTGAYAGAGLAILFFLHLFTTFKSRKYIFKTIGFCMLFFVAIPVVIYLLSYIPFVDPSHPGLLERALANQVNMYDYHSKLEATHSYSSLWYEWPVMIRPIFYYAKQLEGNLRMGISSFGNPFIWWAGIPAFVCTCYFAVFRRERTAAFLAISYLAQFLPWTLVARCTFIYHYFPCVPFIVLMISYCLAKFEKKLTARSFYILLAVYAVLVFVLFILFYPVLAGTAVSTDYVDTCLRWFDTWVLVLL